MTLPPLPEKDFIHEGYRQNPYPFWFWLSFLSIVILILYGGYVWYAKKVTSEFQNSPFLQVTNRQMSLFLWQDPEFMRINAPVKAAYMPAFQYVDKVSMDVPFADDYVLAPPEVLFRYHTWHRLISNEIPLRPIASDEFKEFLDYAPEWLPENWPGAPFTYAQVVRDLKGQSELFSELPISVRLAFQGWKNFFKEGEKINSMVTTYAQVHTFLRAYPHYARNFWQNIVGPSYLFSLSHSHALQNEAISADELSPFLRVSLYNFLQQNSAGGTGE